MDILNPDLQWLLTEMLPDGPLAVLCNESSIFNSFCYFDEKSLKLIQSILDKKEILGINSFFLSGPSLCYTLYISSSKEFDCITNLDLSRIKSIILNYNELIDKIEQFKILYPNIYLSYTRMDYLNNRNSAIFRSMSFVSDFLNVKPNI